MNFDELTRDEFYGLLRLVDAAAAKLGALRAAMDQGHAKARAAQVEYENAHNELGRAMLRIQVRQMFREGAEDARLRGNGEPVAAAAWRVAFEATATRKGDAV